MIRLTRLNGSEFSLNPDLIHRVEETPDTVLTLIDGSRYVVVQSLADIVDAVVAYRARVVAEANRLGADAALAHAQEELGAASRPVPVQTAADADADVVQLRNWRA